METGPAAVGVIFLTALFASGQTPVFDAASVKAATPPARPAVIRFLPGGRFQAHNSTLLTILQQAFDVTDFQLQGTPGWAASDRFDVEASSPDANAGAAAVRLMVQALLADRFHLRIHRETRPLPVYELLPTKSGIRLQGVLRVDAPAIDANPYGGYLTATGIGMPRFVAALQKWLDRPLIDRTGFDPPFDVKLSWAPGPENSRNAGPIPPAPDDRRPDIFTALQEQLGLRLIAARDPLEVIVIDNLEHPSAN